MKIKLISMLFILFPLMLMAKNSYAKDIFVAEGPFVHNGVLYDYKAYVRTKNRKSVDRMMLLGIGHVWEMQEKFCGHFPEADQSSGFHYSGCNKSGKRCDRVTEFFNCD